MMLNVGNTIWDSAFCVKKCKIFGYITGPLSQVV